MRNIRAIEKQKKNDSKTEEKTIKQRRSVIIISNSIKVATNKYIIQEVFSPRFLIMSGLPFTAKILKPAKEY
jgi:hypothetical protein